MISYLRIIDCPNDNYYKQKHLYNTGWSHRRKMNTVEQESLDEILKKTKTNIRLLIEALSQIKYITDISFTEGKYWSKDFHNFKDVVEFKLDKPVYPDVDNLMRTIISEVNDNCLQADVELNYEIEHKKYEILIEPKKGITSPPKMREAVNWALDKTTRAVENYTKRNPKSIQKEGDNNAPSNN